MIDRVTAMDAVDYDHCVVELDGTDLPQSSNECVIKRMTGLRGTRLLLESRPHPRQLCP